MIFKRLRLERKDYGQFGGQVIGEVEFDGITGAIVLNISPEQAKAILAVCAEALVNTTREVAKVMHQEIRSSSKPQPPIGGPTYHSLDDESPSSL